MTLEARLSRCKQYREEAMKHPIANKLYIEDLNISIEYLEEAVKNNSIKLQKGFVDSEEEGV